MSDFIVKIIPVLSDHTVKGEDAERITKWLKSRINAERIIYRTSDQPEFVDCGSNLNRITCPACEAELSFDWWGEAMQASFESSGFTDLYTVLKCCDKKTSLNDLRYDAPCGFSCVEIDIYNPAETLNKDCLRQIQEMIGCEICLIYSHL